MGTAGQRPLLAALVLAAVALGGCGKGNAVSAEQPGGGGPTRKLAPVAPQGALSVATRNTTRLGGADPTADAAGVARAVYPGLTAATRPSVVVLVDEHDWPAALAASVLAGSPTGAPLLYSEGSTLPTISRQTLEAMHPLGAPALGGAQVIRIGTSAALPNGYIAHQLSTGTPAITAAAIEQLALRLDGSSPPRQVIVLAANAAPTLAMPAAGLAAESGAPILLVTSARIPPPTSAALAALHHPAIYVIDAATIGHRTLAELRGLGSVKVITSGAAGTSDTSPSGAPSSATTSTGATGPATTTRTGTGATATAAGDAAAQNAIEIARFTDGTFGWGVKEPGHGLVFANEGRPLDAPASALLSATGDYGPLLLLASATQLSPTLAHYLSDIQPAYSNPQFPPVRGAYNHGWLIGDEQAISTVTQAEIDSLLEIVPRTQTSEEPSVSQVE